MITPITTCLRMFCSVDLFLCKEAHQDETFLLLLAQKVITIFCVIFAEIIMHGCNSTQAKQDCNGFREAARPCAKV